MLPRSFQQTRNSHQKKRKRQRLSDTEKIEAAFAEIEGVRAVAKLLAAATEPAASTTDPLVQRIIECVSFSAEKLESCASTLHLACSNTAAKKCASLAHRKLEKEERLRQEWGAAAGPGDWEGERARRALPRARGRKGRVREPLQEATASTFPQAPAVPGRPAESSIRWSASDQS